MASNYVGFLIGTPIASLAGMEAHWTFWIMFWPMVVYMGFFFGSGLACAYRFYFLGGK